MIVSHKADHGLERRSVHEETAYGAVKNPEKEGAISFSVNNFLSLTEKGIEQIRDRRLRDLVKPHVETEKAAGRDLKSALQFSQGAAIFRDCRVAFGTCGL